MLGYKLKCDKTTTIPTTVCGRCTNTRSERAGNACLETVLFFSFWLKINDHENVKTMNLLLGNYIIILNTIKT
jgi:hypothetical protein